MPIHPDCLAQVNDMLSEQELVLLTAADKAESLAHTRIHGRVLRNQAAGMGAAVALLRKSAREQAAG